MNIKVMNLTINRLKLKLVEFLQSSKPIKRWISVLIYRALRFNIKFHFIIIFKINNFFLAKYSKVTITESERPTIFKGPPKKNANKNEF
ncbi:hypothetical protein BpHYR1_051994 [Brachionus plicatilis]|uniref:Uncharacterized protein n=1 Tax=Brachionus plicatilis TaxID=10195 RepID=A0A3M7RSW1_BRAPC|nr:hypothetical protein BpHYR1_051994 [Brachionus plicatilis]